MSPLREFLLEVVGSHAPEDRAPPWTDGRPPHTFVEKGLEARWLREDDVVHYETSGDLLRMRAVAVGADTSIEGENVTLIVTAPGSERRSIVVKVGRVIKTTQTNQGNVHEVLAPNFRQTFPSIPPGAGVESYVVEAFFDAELGGDLWSSTVGRIVVV
jgi:hypothetical protein